ncbi:uncharacterized protein LOC144135205 [Amblyomma americanum]
MMYLEGFLRYTVSKPNRLHRKGPIHTSCGKETTVVDLDISNEEPLMVQWDTSGHGSLYFSLTNVSASLQLRFSEKRSTEFVSNSGTTTAEHEDSVNITLHFGTIVPNFAHLDMIPPQGAKELSDKLVSITSEGLLKTMAMAPIHDFLERNFAPKLLRALKNFGNLSL